MNKEDYLLQFFDAHPGKSFTLKQIADHFIWDKRDAKILLDRLLNDEVIDEQNGKYEGLRNV